jgi:ABC-type branched-subunit amino acid transport system ATPase component
MALAIARMPAVFIADEPYRGITPADHDELTKPFRTLVAEARAVVITGH